MNGNCYFCDYYLEGDFSPQELDFPWDCLPKSPLTWLQACSAHTHTPHTLRGEPASNSIPQPESADISCLNKDKAPRKAFCEPEECDS